MWDLKAFPWKILRIEIEFESNFSSISQHLRSSGYSTFLIDKNFENYRLSICCIHTYKKKICNFTGNTDHINKSKETRVVAYTCRCSSGLLIANSVTTTD